MFSYADAFRLIPYLAEDRSSKELVWNSRDGIAPQWIDLRDGRRAVRIAGMPEPQLPNHRPSIGDLILVDEDEDWAAQDAAEVAARRWSPQLDCTQDEFEADVLDNHRINIERGHPRAVVVTEAMARERGWLLVNSA